MPKNSTATATKDPDLAARVAAALARTDVPRSTDTGKFDPKKHDVLGHVPTHLRHLHNLLDTISDEAITLEKALERKKVDLETVRDLFFSSLLTAAPPSDDHTEIMVCDGWLVAGIKEDGGEAPDLPDGHKGIVDMIVDDIMRRWEHA